MKPVTLGRMETITIFSLMERSLLTIGKLSEADKELAKKLYDHLDDGEKSVIGNSHSTVIEQIETVRSVESNND
jgi:hypothetical protein